MGCLTLILGICAVLGVSWAITIGIVYLITMCFGLVWSIKIATGVWLVMFLLTGVFKTTVNVKK